MAIPEISSWKSGLLWHVFFEKSFVWVALDYYFLCWQVMKISQKNYQYSRKVLVQPKAQNKSHCVWIVQDWEKKERKISEYFSNSRWWHANLNLNHLQKEHQFILHLILAWTIHINICTRVAHGASLQCSLFSFFWASDKQKCWPIPHDMMIQIVYLHLQQIWIFCQIGQTS